MDIGKWTAKQAETFESAVASVDVVDSGHLKGTETQIATVLKETPLWIGGLIDQTSTDLKEPIGLYWHAGDGGLLICTDVDELILFCDRLTVMVPLFNRIHERDDVRLRITCGFGTFQNSESPGTLYSRALNYLKHDEKDVGIAGHVVVSSPLFHKVSNTIRARLSPYQHKGNEEYYVLDGDQTPTTIHEHTPESLIRWIRASIQPEEKYLLQIFSYTNDSLFNYLPNLPKNVRIKILMRNWLAEPQAFEASTIRRNAEYLIERAKKLKIKFYDGSPWLKGAMLKRKARGNRPAHREAHVGIYPWRPRTDDTSPYVIPPSPIGMVLKEDNGHQSESLDAIGTRFRNLWQSGSTYEVLVERSKQVENKEALKDSSKSVWAVGPAKYLLVLAGRHVPDRSFLYIAGEDMIGISSLRSLLEKLGAEIDPNPVIIDAEKDWKEPVSGGAAEKWKRILDFPGHVIFICRYTLANKEITQHLTSQGFPYLFSWPSETSIYIKEPSLIMQRWPSPIDSNINVDLGFVGRLPGPISPFKWFVVTGVHARGTWGCCQLMADQSELLKLFETAKDQDFAFLVESEFKDQFPFELKEARRYSEIKRQKDWRPYSSYPD